MAERRTRAVTIIALVTMAVEFAGGLAFGSMALLADGLHMASHTLAMGIAVFAYAYARWHATDPRFTFGTGKVNVLAGYTGAILLTLSAVWMMTESLERWWSPTRVRYAEAAAVAGLGLAVNLASAWLLRDDHNHSGCRHAHDHNLRAVYFHVLADAATSVLAIGALLAASSLGARWLDPLAGLLGGGLVAWWAIGLLRATSGILLDHQAPELLRSTICGVVEWHGDKVVDLRCWAVGQGQYAAAVTVVARERRCSDDYRRLLPAERHLAWVSFQIDEVPEAALAEPHVAMSLRM